MHAHPPRGFSLVGPGRAGSAVAVALAARGWRAVAVAGRAAGAASTIALAARLGADARDVADAGRGADLVVVATPDAAIADAAAASAPGVEPGALVVHLSGACGLEELDKLHVARPDVEVGVLVSGSFEPEGTPQFMFMKQPGGPILRSDRDEEGSDARTTEVRAR